MKHTPMEPLHREPLRGEGDMVREQEPSAPVGELYEYGMLEKPQADLGTPWEKNGGEAVPFEDAAPLADGEARVEPE